jgi:hypothetical protein
MLIEGKVYKFAFDLQGVLLAAKIEQSEAFFAGERRIHVIARHDPQSVGFERAVVVTAHSSADAGCTLTGEG